MGRASQVLTAVAVGALVLGCASFKPQPLGEIGFRDRVETASRNGLTVSVAVLSRDEAKRAFGVDLYKKQIQPVWLRIQNETEHFHRFMLHSIDPEYFSAHEAAYKSHFRWRPRTNRRMDDHFDGLGIIPAVPQLGSTEGFAFTNAKLGIKGVRVRLWAEGSVEDFQFYVSVPGFRADWHEVDWHGLYSEDEIVEIETEQELLVAIRGLPCCTTRQNGTGQGDPLNMIVIAEEGGLEAFVRAGWDETELLTFASGWRTFRAFFGGEYKYSPMSALYVFGRPQDIGLQKARDTIHERNHLRLWMSPWLYRGRFVWVGAISRDIGVYFTRRAWNLTTHAIDPDIDEARDYLTEDLATAEAVERFGLIEGVGRATSDDPHRNLMMAPWWSDGYRAVFLLSGDTIPLDQVDFFDWFEFGGVLRKLEGVELKGRLPAPTDEE